MSGEISEKVLRAIDKIEINLTDKGAMKTTVLDSTGSNLFVNDLNMAQTNKLLESIRNLAGVTLADMILSGKVVLGSNLEYIYKYNSYKFDKIKVIARDDVGSINIKDINKITLKPIGNGVVALFTTKSGNLLKLDGIESINDLLNVYYASGITNIYELLAKGILIKDPDFDRDYEFGDAKKINRKNKDVLASIDNVEYETKANGTVVGKIKYTDGTSRNITSVDDINAIFDLFYKTGSFNNITDILATGKVKKIGDLTDAFEYTADNKHISKKLVKTDIIEIKGEAKPDKTVTGTITYADGTTKPIANIDELNAALDILYTSGAGANIAELIRNRKVAFPVDINTFEYTDGKHLRDKTLITTDIDTVEFETKSDGTLTGTIKYTDGTTKPIANIGEYNAALDKLYAQGIPGVADADLNIAKLIAAGKVITKNALDLNVFKYNDGKHLSVVAKIVEKIVLDVKADGSIVRQVKYMDGTTKDLADIDEVNEEIKKLSKEKGKNLTELMNDGFVVASDSFKNTYDIKGDKRFATKKTKKKNIIRKLIIYGSLVAVLITGIVHVHNHGFKIAGNTLDDDDDLTRGNNDNHIEQGINDYDGTLTGDGSTITVEPETTFNSGSDEELLLMLADEGKNNEQTAVPTAKPVEINSHYGNDSDIAGPNIRDPKVDVYNYTEYGSMSQDSMDDQVNYLTQLFLSGNPVDARTFENMIVPEDREAVMAIVKKKNDVDYGRCTPEEFMTDYVHYKYYDEPTFDGVSMKSDEDVKPFGNLVMTYAAQSVNEKCADGKQIGDTEFTKDTLGNNLVGDVDVYNALVRGEGNRLGY